MAVENPDWRPPRPEAKGGFGLSITLEALVEILRDRYPNLLQWSEVRTPSLAYDAATGRLALYQVVPGSLAYSQTDVALPPRRVGEGAPIPSVSIDYRSTRTEEGLPRCGHFGDGGAPIDQCQMVRGHQGPHGKIERL